MWPPIDLTRAELEMIVGRVLPTTAGAGLEEILLIGRQRDRSTGELTKIAVRLSFDAAGGVELTVGEPSDEPIEPVDGYRQNHLAHHQHTNTDKDPDWVVKLGTAAFTFPQKARDLFLRLAGYFVAVSSVRDLAHLLPPLVAVCTLWCSVLLGRGHGAPAWPRVASVTPAFFAELQQHLRRHELVKLRFLGAERDERAALCTQIADEGRCVFVGAVGHTALFYRQHPEPKARVVALPGE